MNVVIRQESPSDIAAVHDVTRDAFLNAPHTAHTEQFIVDALRLLQERDAAGCVLVGDPAYYARFGFKPESGLIVSDVPPEYFQALPFGRSLPSGVVTFHEALKTRG